MARIREVRRIAESTGQRFFVNARTDVFFQRPRDQHDEGMVVEAAERGRPYADAGADGLFAPGLVDLGLIAQLVEASRLPLNIMVGEATPPRHRLAEQGVARISHGPGPYRRAMAALEEAARAAADAS